MDRDRADPNSDIANQPTLTDMTKAAIKRLKRSENGFFLLVEAGRIDHGHHENYVQRSLGDVLELENAIKVRKE